MEQKSNNWDTFSMLQAIIVSLLGLGISKINAMYCLWIKYSLILEKGDQKKKKMDRLSYIFFRLLIVHVLFLG